ncbi:GNAT family N-acetyltransferase [Clostridium sp. UBA7503]|uniref:GNAT family N-acetyltransferase n=1 Tax=Clostridium sp. UBA7503 TaxID=1946377 RepID=UPI0032171383
MSDYRIIKIQERPELKNYAANWFHEKWNIPLEAYLESIDECMKNKNPVPQWYIVIIGDRIVGGLGVIENDFHNRKDLTPNVCAIYVEDDYRCQGIAGKMLNYVCDDMKEKNIDTLYLVTDHTSFYERYGWEFLCMVQAQSEKNLTRMYIHRTI